jgi:hypothetical protein
MLSSSTVIEDGDWDSVRQATAALSRDLERLMLSFGEGGGDFGGATPKSAQDQRVAQDGNYGFNAVTMDMLLDLEARLRAIIAAIPPPPPPPTSLAVGGDLSGTTASASVIKLRGTSISSTAPSVDEQFLVYNLPLTKWEPVTVIANNGGLLSKDGAGLIEVDGGTALSVVGNATNTAGSINAIAAASADTVLGRRGTSLTWAKVARAEQADGSACSVVGRAANSAGVVADIAAASDNLILGRRSSVLTWAKVARAEQADGSACSVVGRAANSAGVLADITASADGQVLQRLSGTVQFAAFSGLPTAPSGAGWALTHNGTSASWSQTPTLGNTSAAGSLTISNTTSASAIVLATTLINAAGKVMSVREIDVCDGGVAKKMLVLASAPY